MERKELINFFLDLTPTEREFLFWHCRNRTKNSIMTLMMIKLGTYDTHLRNITRKLPPPHNSTRLKVEVCEEYRIIFPEESDFFIKEETDLGEHRRPNLDRWADFSLAFGDELKKIEESEKEEKKPEVEKPPPIDTPPYEPPTGEGIPVRPPGQATPIDPEPEPEPEPTPQEPRPIIPPNIPRPVSILIGIIIVVSVMCLCVNRCTPVLRFLQEVFFPAPVTIPRPTATIPVVVRLTQTYEALPEPTNTPTITFTPTITLTPTITPTSTITPTPTNTETPTPIPVFTICVVEDDNSILNETIPYLQREFQGATVLGFPYYSDVFFNTKCEVVAADYTVNFETVGPNATLRYKNSYPESVVIGYYMCCGDDQRMLDYGAVQIIRKPNLEALAEAIFLHYIQFIP